MGIDRRCHRTGLYPSVSAESIIIRQVFHNMGFISILIRITGGPLIQQESPVFYTGDPRGSAAIES